MRKLSWCWDGHGEEHGMVLSYVVFGSRVVVGTSGVGDGTCVVDSTCGLVGTCKWCGSEELGMMFACVVAGTWMGKDGSVI